MTVGNKMRPRGRDEELEAAALRLRTVLENMTTTSTVLTSPSTLTTKTAQELVKYLPLGQLLHDLGVIAGGVVASELDSRALRPADYANLPELQQVLLRRLLKELGSKPDIFMDAFVKTLRMRG